MKLDAAVREALALHESFRRLGFSPDDIYVRPTGTQLFIVVRRDGKEFNAEAGAYSKPIAHFRIEWAIAVAWWNQTAVEAERKRVFESSAVFANSASFVMAVLEHGFSITKEADA